VAIQDSFDQWAALSEGAYVLRSNVTEWSDEKLGQAYIHRWTPPRFVKRSVNDGEKVKIAAIDPDFA
jgi:hypothetical protein